jgi:nucleoside-diphosphate-sugar epimerase
MSKLVDMGVEQPLGVDIRPPIGGIKRGSLFSQCDLLDSEKLHKIVREFAPETVVHLAARTDVDGRSVNEYSVNFEGTRNLIDAISTTPAVQRALFASSQLVCRVGYVPCNDTDYCPINPYGESKVMSEKIVRQSMPDNIAWCLLRPTTIWGEGMSAHYRGFLGHLQAGRYLQMGHGPLYKSYGYIGNATYQIGKFMTAERLDIDQKTFYLGDYQPLSLTAWTNSLALALGVRRPRSIPVPVARLLGLCGDVINLVGFKRFPLNSYRVRNITTEYIFDLKATEKICGSLPFTVEQGVARMAAWFKSLQIADAEEQ